MTVAIAYPSHQESCQEEVGHRMHPMFLPGEVLQSMLVQASQQPGTLVSELLA